MKTKNKKSEKRSPKPEPLRKSIEDRDLNEDEQQQITNADDVDDKVEIKIREQRNRRKDD